MVPDSSKSLRQGALAAWGNKASGYYWQMLEAVAEHYRFDLMTPEFAPQLL